MSGSIIIKSSLKIGPVLRKEPALATIRLILAAAGYPDYNLGLVLTSDQIMAQHNRNMLRKEGPTDVISVPGPLVFLGPNRLDPRWKKLVDRDPVMRDLGDIYMSVAYVQRKAAEQRKSFSRHFVRLARSRRVSHESV